MSELLYRQQPNISLDDKLAATPLEITDDFISMTANLGDIMLEFTSEELRQFYGEEPQRKLSLQEQYNLPYDPDKTVRGAGFFAIKVVMTPDFIQHEVAKETLDTVSGVEKEHNKEKEMTHNTASSGVEYAQDSQEYAE
jgi:hypothetical protein